LLSKSLPIKSFFIEESQGSVDGVARGSQPFILISSMEGR
jgi:hypothetical protein